MKVIVLVLLLVLPFATLGGSTFKFSAPKREQNPFRHLAMIACNSTSFVDDTFQGCTSCNKPCVLCSFILDNCIECDSNPYQSPYCTKCEDGFIVDNSNSLCRSCDRTCETCGYESTKEVCLTCPNGRYLHNGACLESCPTGFYGENKQCNSCPTECSACDSADVCTSCVKSNFTTASKCTQCDSDNEYVLTTGGDCELCPNHAPVGDLLFNYNTLQCEACPVSCKTCSWNSAGNEGAGALECTACKAHVDGYIPSYTQTQEFERIYFDCYASPNGCPDGTFYGNDVSAQEIYYCFDCNVECSTCVDTADKCLTCPDDRVFESSNNTCPTCTSIIDGCDRCAYQGGSLKCTRCNPTTHFLYGNACYTAAEAMTFENPAQQGNGGYILSDCNVACADTCLDASPFSCNSCNQGGGYTRSPFTGACQTTCEAGTIKKTAGCSPCQTGHAQCNACNPTETSTWDDFTCTGCDPNYALVGTTVCKDCEECSECTFNGDGTVKTCTACNAGFFFDAQSGSCVADCKTLPTNKFDDNVGGIDVCSQCDASCDGCTGSSTACDACAAGYSMHLDDNTCHSDCTALTSGGKQLIDNGSQQCVLCDTMHADCLVCSYQATVFQCDQCETLYLRTDNTCNASCSETDDHVWLGTAPNKSCITCLTHTAQRVITCDQTGAIHLSCSNGWYLSVDTCVDTCPPGTWANDADNTCTDCNPECATCTSSASDCQTCQDVTTTRFFHQVTSDQCLTTCPTGYYIPDNGNACIICRDGAATCELQAGTLVDLTCANTYYLLPTEKRCVQNCRSFGGSVTGYFNGSTDCEQCDSTCSDCTAAAADKCITCKTGLFTEKDSVAQTGTCSPCSTGLYSRDGNNCIACPSYCQQDCAYVGEDRYQRQDDQFGTNYPIADVYCAPFEGGNGCTIDDQGVEYVLKNTVYFKILPGDIQSTGISSIFPFPICAPRTEEPEPGYFLDENASPIIINMCDPMCVECTRFDKKCTKCSPGYYLDADNYCIACETAGIDGCVTCELVNEKVQCTGCEYPIDFFDRLVEQEGNIPVQPTRRRRNLFEKGVIIGPIGPEPYQPINGKCPICTDGRVPYRTGFEGQILCLKCTDFDPECTQCEMQYDQTVIESSGIYADGAKKMVCLTDCGAGFYGLVVDGQTQNCLPCPDNCENCAPSQFDPQNILCSSCLDSSTHILSNQRCVPKGSYYGYKADGIRNLDIHECRHDCAHCTYDLKTFQLSCQTCKSGYESLEIEIGVKICTPIEGQVSCEAGQVLKIDRIGNSECISCPVGCNSCKWDIYTQVAFCTHDITGCPAGFTLVNGSCQINNDNTGACTASQYYDYSDLSNLVCKDCPVGCSACEQNQTNKQVICTSCDVNYFKGNNRCWISCDPTTYPAYTNVSETAQVCLDCPDNCAVCANNFSITPPVQCLECVDGFYYSQETRSCVALPECQSLQYVRVKNTGVLNYQVATCNFCPSGCLGCAYIEGQGLTCNCETMGQAAGCTSCLDTYTLNGAICEFNNFYQRPQCLPLPGSPNQGRFNQYNVLTNQWTECKDCIDGCAVCENGVTCLSCAQGFFKNQQGKCIALQECLSNEYNIVKADGTTPQCVSCPSQCLTCTLEDIFSPLDLVCDSCVEGYEIQGKKCVLTSIPAEIPNTQFLFNNKIYECAEFGCNTCELIEGEFRVKCLSCQPDIEVLQEDNTCQSVCISNTFYNADSSNCEVCDDSCNGCTGSLSTDCKLCAQGYELLENACVVKQQEQQVDCGSEASFDRYQNKCVCHDVKKFYGNQLCSLPEDLTSQCPTGTYRQGQICLTCAQNCAYCSGNEISQCLECKDGYYMQDNQCVKCAEGCQRCSREFICDVCEPGFVLGSYGVECFPGTCPAGQLPYLPSLFYNNPELFNEEDIQSQFTTSEQYTTNNPDIPAVAIGPNRQPLFESPLQIIEGRYAYLGQLVKISCIDCIEHCIDCNDYLYRQSPDVEGLCIAKCPEGELCYRNYQSAPQPNEIVVLAISNRNANPVTERQNPLEELELEMYLNKELPEGFKYKWSVDAEYFNPASITFESTMLQLWKNVNPNNKVLRIPAENLIESTYYGFYAEVLDNQDNSVAQLHIEVQTSAKQQNNQNQETIIPGLQEAMVRLVSTQQGQVLSGEAFNCVYNLASLPILQLGSWSIEIYNYNNGQLLNRNNKIINEVVIQSLMTTQENKKMTIQFVLVDSNNNRYFTTRSINVIANPEFDIKDSTLYKNLAEDIQSGIEDIQQISDLVQELATDETKQSCPARDQADVDSFYGQMKCKVGGSNQCCGNGSCQLSERTNKPVCVCNNGYKGKFCHLNASNDQQIITDIQDISGKVIDQINGAIDNNEINEENADNFFNVLGQVINNGLVENQDQKDKIGQIYEKLADNAYTEEQVTELIKQSEELEEMGGDKNTLFLQQLRAVRKQASKLNSKKQKSNIDSPKIKSNASYFNKQNFLTNQQIPFKKILNQKSSLDSQNAFNNSKGNDLSAVQIIYNKSELQYMFNDLQNMSSDYIVDITVMNPDGTEVEVNESQCIAIAEFDVEFTTLLPYSTGSIANFNNISCKFLNLDNETLQSNGRLETTGVTSEGFELKEFNNNVVVGTVKCCSNHLTSFTTQITNNCNYVYKQTCYSACPAGTVKSTESNTICLEIQEPEQVEVEKEKEVIVNKTKVKEETDYTVAIIVIVLVVVLLIVAAVGFVIWKKKHAKKSEEKYVEKETVQNKEIQRLRTEIQNERQRYSQLQSQMSVGATPMKNQFQSPQNNEKKALNFQQETGRSHDDDDILASDAALQTQEDAINTMNKGNNKKMKMLK